MTEPTNDNTQVTPPPAATPPQGNSNADVVKQLTQVTQELTQAKAQLDALAKERDALKTANEQNVAKVTDLETKFKQADAELKTKLGELTNLQTEVQQRDVKIGELTTNVQGLTKQAELFNLIASDPTYHGMVGSFQNLSKVIKPDASPDDVKALLGAMATDAKQQTQSALELFRAGGTPPANHGNDTTPPGPKNAEEAHAQWQLALRSGDKLKQAEAMRAMQQFLTVVDNTQPA